MALIGARELRWAGGTSRPLLFCAIALLAGCATWRGGSPGELDSDSGPPERLLIITKDRAVDLDEAHTDGGELRGMLFESWRLPAGRDLDAESIRFIQQSDDSPREIARQLDWKSEFAASVRESVRFPLSEIRFVRVYRGNRGRTAAAVVGGLFGGLVLVAGIGLAVFAATFHPSCGRPLRVRGQQIITGVRRRSGARAWSDPISLSPVPEDARRILAEVWALEARGEHAAVAAFSKTSLELMALGAPPDLVVRANRAAIQEVEHARLCFAVASAYGGETLEPAPLPEALAGDTPDLLRLARESLLDGCLREGLASQIAGLGAERARDPQIRRVLRVQAKEEAQHAELSWAIVEWAIEGGGERMRRSLEAAVEKLEFPRCDDLPEHGRIGRALVEPLFHEIRSAASARLASYRCVAAA
jgi:hypothetical protein